jgi:hypothetical protein
MTKVFESPDNGNTIYSRDFGSSDRELVSEYDTRTSDGRPLHEHIKEDQLWGQIRRAAKTNPALQIALDHVKVIYYLSKQDNDSVQHHSV